MMDKDMMNVASFELRKLRMRKRAPPVVILVWLCNFIARQ